MFRLTKTATGDHSFCQNDTKIACLKADAYSYYHMYVASSRIYYTLYIIY